MVAHLWKLGKSNHYQIEYNPGLLRIKLCIEWRRLEKQYEKQEKEYYDSLQNGK